MSALERLAALVQASDPEGSVTVRVSWLAELLASESTDASDPNFSSLKSPAASVHLTVNQVAELFGRGASTVRTWLGAGEFPNAYRLHGREWRVPQSDVEELQRRQRAAHHESIASTTKPAAVPSQSAEWPNFGRRAS